MFALPKALDPKTDAVFCGCGELKLDEPPKIDPPETGDVCVDPPNIEPDFGVATFAIKY